MASEQVQPVAKPPLTAPWWVRMTSPVHFALAFLLAWLAQQVFALPLLPDNLRAASHVVGTVLANAGWLLALWCILLFRLRRTTVMPGGQPSGIVVRGPYRFSRNPMYLGLLAGYIGLALILDVPWALLTMLPALWLLARAILPFEEARMQAQFGDAYRDYQRRVRRWL